MARLVPARLVPASLTARVFTLYAAALVVVVAATGALFYRYQFTDEVDNAVSAMLALAEVMSPTISDSAVIGDYDTIRRTLAKATRQDDIAGASFLGVQGGRIVVDRPRDQPHWAPPWLRDAVQTRVGEVNTVIAVGGVDYGVLRLRFDADRIAGDIWHVTSQAFALLGAALAAALIVMRWSLRRWLAPLEHIRDFTGGTADAAARREAASGAPREIREALSAFERTDAALRMERVTAAATLGAVGDAVVTSDARGRILYANPAAVRLFGLPDGATDRRVLDLLPSLAAAACDEGAVPPWDRVHVVLPPAPATGRAQVVHLETTMTPILDDRGLAVGHVLTCRDVTANKAYEDRLTAELEARQSAMASLREALRGMLGESEWRRLPASDTDLESVALLVADLVRQRESSRRELDNRIFALDQHAAVSIADVHGTITYVNQRMVDLGGYSGDELIGVNHRLLSSGLHEREFYGGLWRTIASGRVWHGEIANRHKDGSVYWVATTIVPWLDEHGAPYQYIAIRTDITRRKEVEAEFRKLALIAARTQSSVFLTDVHGGVTWVNEGFTRLTGYTLDEVRGRRPRSFLHGPDTDEEVERRFRTPGDEGTKLELLNYAKDGRAFWVLAEVQPLRDETGRIDGYMAIQTDITEQRAARQRLEMQYQVSAVLGESDDLATGLDGVLRAVCEGVGCEIGQVWRRDGERLQLLQSWHRPGAAVEEFGAASRALDCQRGQGLAGRVWADGRPQWLEDIATQPGSRRAPVAARAGLHGGLAFPLLVRGDTWGVAEFFSARVERPDDLLLKTAATIGVHVGGFILRSQAQEAMQRSEQFFRSIFEDAQIGMSVATLEGQYLRVNDALCEMFGYTQAELVGKTAADLMHPEDRAAMRESRERMRRAETGVHGGETRYLRRDGTVVWVIVRSRVLPGDSGRPELLLSQLLDVSSQKESERALREEKRLLEEAKEREIQTGYQIQRSLLIGEPPAGIPGVEIAGYAEPSRGIDGDFYAFTRFGPECFELLVGDVMGKGVPAALMGAAVRTSYHQVVTELTAASGGADRLPQPQEVVNALHRTLTPNLIALDTFVTLALYRFDLARGRLAYVNAGHTPGLMRRRTGRIERLLGENLPLGVIAGERYREVECPIGAGDWLLAYSDGISEARDAAGAEFGEDGLCGALQRLMPCDAPARAMLQALSQGVHEHAGGVVLADDETAVLVGLRDAPGAAAGPGRADDGNAAEELFELPWDLGRLAPLRAKVAAAAAAAALDAEQADRLVLAAFEAATNVVRHVPTGVPNAVLSCRLRRSLGRVTVELWYPGTAFTPPAEPQPDFSGRSEGGFGLYIIEQSVSRVSYEEPAPGLCCVRLDQRAATPVRA